MARSLKKGPYVFDRLLKKVEEMKIDKGEVKKVTQGKVKEEKKEN